MTAAETIERLTELVKMQADIIKEQANALMQLGAVVTPGEGNAPSQAPLVRKGSCQRS